MSNDIAEIERQEAELIFESFDQETAFELGTAAVAAMRTDGTPMAVQIVVGDHIVFKATTGGVSADTDPWLAGKAAAATLFESSTLRVRLRKDADPSIVDGIDEDTYRTHGGSFPLRVRDRGIVGTITVSGATDTVDHAIAVSALTSVLGRE
jgi:uncharacterized protein (UPF0303 family)